MADNKKKKEEVTIGEFKSPIRFFIGKLRKKPIDAKMPKKLEDIGFTKTKLIDELIDRGIIKRKETIKDQTDSEEYKKPTYILKYTIIAKDFEKKIDEMYHKYFDTNGFLKDGLLKEDEGGGADAGGGDTANSDSGGMFGNAGDNGRGAFVQPMSKKPIRRVFLNEKQFRYIKTRICPGYEGCIEETTSTGDVGSVGDYTANGLVLKTKNGKKDPSYER